MMTVTTNIQPDRSGLGLFLDVKKTWSLSSLTLLALFSSPLLYAGTLAKHTNLTVTNRVDYVGSPQYEGDQPNQHQVRILADELEATDESSGNKLMLRNVNVLIDMEGSGLNGLDSGSPEDDTWYHIYVVCNTAKDCGGVFSVSHPRPQSPAEYNHVAYVGAMYQREAGDFTALRQHNAIASTKNTREVEGAGKTTGPVKLTLKRIPATANIWLGTIKIKSSSEQTLGARIYMDGTTSAGMGPLLDNIHIQGEGRYLYLPVRQHLWFPQTLWYRFYSGDEMDIETRGWEF